MTAPFGRVLTAMITPFDSDGALDHGRAWELARHLVAHGSEGLVVAGTTGESPTLEEDEKLALFATVVDAVGGKAAVVAGTGSYDTASSVELTVAAAEAGVDAVMAVTPYYSRPSQDGLVAHFTAIAEASDRPLMLYNIPSRTGRLIEVSTLADLAAHPQIVAVKDAVGDLSFTTRTVIECGADFAVYSGDDVLALPMMAVGGVGVVSVSSHLAGPEIARMVSAAERGDWAEATKLHLALAPLSLALFSEPSPSPVKSAMNALWAPVGEPRLPLVGAAPETVDAVKEALAAAQQA